MPAHTHPVSGSPGSLPPELPELPPEQPPELPEQPPQFPAWRVRPLRLPRQARAGPLREWGRDVLALLWPAHCAGCGRPDRQLCAGCARRVLRDGTQPRELGELAEAVLSVPCFVMGAYEGPARSALIAYKHGGAYAMSGLLGVYLAPALLRACAESGPGPPPLIVPLPSRTARMRERGYRHVEILVRIAARVCASTRIAAGVGVRGVFVPARPYRALRATRGRTTQVALGAAARERNAARIAVTRGAELRGREVVLVDDIITTGASCRAAITELERAGARVIAVAALCAVVRVGSTARPTPSRECAA